MMIEAKIPAAIYELLLPADTAKKEEGEKKEEKKEEPKKK